MFILIILNVNVEKFETSTQNQTENCFRLSKYESVLLELNIKYAIFPLNNDETKISRFVRARIELGFIISIAGGKDRSTHSTIGLRRDLRHRLGSKDYFDFLRTERSINVPTKQKRRNDIIYRYCYDGVILFLLNFSLSDLRS